MTREAVPFVVQDGSSYGTGNQGTMELKYGKALEK